VSSWRCRRLELFSEASVAIDGSKFKAVNTRDRNFTQAKMQRRLAQIDESIAQLFHKRLAEAANDEDRMLIRKLIAEEEATNPRRTKGKRD
jgi:hypothetical protein